MDEKRWITFIVVATLILLVMNIQLGRKQRQYEQAQRAKQEQRRQTADDRDAATTAAVTLADGETTPTADQPATGRDTTPEPTTRPTRRGGTFSQYITDRETFIDIRSDKLDVRLSTRGGVPVSWKTALPHNGGKSGENDWIELIPQVPGRDSTERPLEVQFTVFKTNFYRINNVNFEVSKTYDRDAATTTVTFLSPVIEQLQLEKTYTFNPDSYITELSVELINQSDSWINIEHTFEGVDSGVSLSWGPGLRQYDREVTRNDTWYASTLSATPEDLFYKNPSADKPRIDEGNLLWGGIQDKFFAAVIVPLENPIPIKGARSTIRERNRIKDSNLAQMYTDPFTYEIYTEPFDMRTADSGKSQVQLDYELFTGPKDRRILNAINERLAAITPQPVDMSRLLFYDSWSWMRALSFLMLWALDSMFALTGSWGLSIILLTVIVRLVMHPLSHKGMKLQAQTMEDMKRIKPEIDAVNEKYKEDPMKKNQAIMDLYKKHGINPFAPLKGCWPMLIQLPIFIALYKLLNQSISLRGAEFLYISSLAEPDHLVAFSTITFGAINSLPYFGAWFNFLPLLMGASQYVIMKFTSTTPTNDPNQKMIMMMMPLILPVVLYTLPSGLFVYWIVSNFWQLGHQLYAKRAIHRPGGEAEAEKQKSAKPARGRNRRQKLSTGK